MKPIDGELIIQEKFPTKRKKTVCVQVLGESGYTSTLPNQWCYLGEEEGWVLRWICVLLYDCLFHVRMGLPVVQAQLYHCHQCGWCLGCCRGEKPGTSTRVFSAFPAGPLAASLQCAHYMQAPFSPKKYTQGLNFWGWWLLTIDQLFSSLEAPFFTEINLYGQRFSQMSLGYFQQSELTTTAINCVWAGATSPHHFPAVAKVWRRWRAGQGISVCRTVAAGQDISYSHQKFPR